MAHQCPRCGGCGECGPACAIATRLGVRGAPRRKQRPRRADADACAYRSMAVRVCDYIALAHRIVWDGASEPLRIPEEHAPAEIVQLWKQGTL
ncbi:protealysin inhibitor emfourin [Xanthomonas axonopodis]|uniref:protealysin inhibitor emfourin n=1 Tax=Xanthomonas axonopodis TaxID=53413 RepID=UPI003CCE6566